MWFSPRLGMEGGMAFLDALRPRTFVENHPGRAELVPEHRKAHSEKGLLHRHEDLTTIGEEGINALRLVCAAEDEGKVDATHGLKTIGRDVGTDELRCSDADTGVKNGIC